MKKNIKKIGLGYIKRKIVKQFSSVTVGTKNESVRNEWLEKTLKSIPKGLKILDAGAGELKNKKYCAHLDYVSQDFCQYDGSGDGNGLQTNAWNTDKIDIVGDIENIAVADESFDVVLCSEVLEHLPNPVSALNELHRLLKQGGIIIITAPFCSLTHFAPYHYSTGFNRYFYEFHLDKLGFAIDEIMANGNFFEYLGQEIGRIRSIGKKYTVKKSSLLDKIALKIVLRMLKKFSKHDSNSQELLCFGYHVIATKK